MIYNNITDSLRCMRIEKWNMYLNILQDIDSYCNHNHTSEKLKFIVDFIPPDKFPLLLNIGCGNGSETKVLNDLGYDVVGLIKGEANKKYAHDNFPNLKFIDNDLHDLDIKYGSFNAVYMNHVFEHVYAPFIFMLELNCILTEGGRVWTGGPEFNELDDPLGQLNRERYFCHPNLIRYDTMKIMSEAAGFKILYNTPIKGNPYFDNPYLLEKKPFRYLHSDVQKAILKRKEIYGSFDDNRVSNVLNKEEILNKDLVFDN